ncbi:hypothetical protein PVL29_006364 [Vitis rotundifolia]|uniref:Uncharacterized protein n=1 Tax=Vitis rotundifolia TaxID=103349 RepID=A0AA39A6Z5_VITRO|nr:hypothetical protein PVL29_006364 [Vitis rotundifolia]
MDMELVAAMWLVKIIYDWTLTAMGILDAPTPVVLWPMEITDDSSPTGMGMLDSLMEVVAP